MLRENAVAGTRCDPPQQLVVEQTPISRPPQIANGSSLRREAVEQPRRVALRCGY
jgi:hypothetical protein